MDEHSAARHHLTRGARRGWGTGMMTAIDLIANAKDQSRRGRHAEAIISAEAAVKADPENADAWWQLSLNHLLSGETQAAIPHLERTLSLAPHYAYGWRVSAKLCLTSGSRSGAKKPSFER